MCDIKFILSLMVTIQFVAAIFGNPSKDKSIQLFSGMQESTQCRIALDELRDLQATIKDLKQQIPVTNIKDMPIFDMRYDKLEERCNSLGTYSSCAEATACNKRSGYYYIGINQVSRERFLVECDAYTEGGDWTVIQRRRDGSVDFHRTWSEYKSGFGDVDGEFFIGLDKLHALTNYNGPQELLIQMESGNSTRAFAKYDSFRIGSEAEKYSLKSLGHYNGTAGDGLSPHLAMKFTTKDADNDVLPNGNCAVLYMGGWWYTSGHVSNLNGHYGDTAFARGVGWYYFTGHYTSLVTVKMMIRRRRNSME